MKSSIKLHKDDLKKFYDFLLENNIEVNTEIVNKRVLMFRSKKGIQWSQGYDGKTRSGKNERDFIRIFGPDESLVKTFYNKK